MWDCDAAAAATSCMPPVCIGLNRRNQIAIAIPKALITAIAQDAAERPDASASALVLPSSTRFW